MKSENTPYVKEYNANGELLNPIIGSYTNKGLNRSKRHKLTKNRRCKSVQLITDENGKVIKKIKHYN